MRTPNNGDIWLVNYPYITPGNMKKIRPAIIRKINNDTNKLVVQKLSTKKHKGSTIYKHPKLKRMTFLSKEITTISEYDLIRYIGNDKDRKRVI